MSRQTASRRSFLHFAAASLSPASAAARSGAVKLAGFRADATPATGEPLIWVTPLQTVLDPLWAKGLVLEQGGRRLVICAMDWCALGGAAYHKLRHAMAQAAGGAEVLLHTVHQHAAPYVDGDAYALLRELPNPPLLYTVAGLDQLADRLARAVKEALGKLRPVEQIGVSQAQVERVASSRRVWDQGKLVVRYSTGGRDSYQAQLPEGHVDPWLKTITFASGGRPLARLHFYATHPQTFCCDGRASADFVGEARERLEREEGAFQIYLTGCAGDVTVGKYNDGSEEARRQLAERLLAAMKAAASDVRFYALKAARWRTIAVRLPAREPDKPIEAPADPTARYRAACRVAFAHRKAPLLVTAVNLGEARILHLPGEPMLDFQIYAQRRLPQAFVATAGYGDIAPGYLCTDQAIREGGYEPSASHVAVGGESALKEAIGQALAV